MEGGGEQETPLDLCQHSASVAAADLAAAALATAAALGEGLLPGGGGAAAGSLVTLVSCSNASVRSWNSCAAVALGF